MFSPAVVLLPLLGRWVWRTGKLRAVIATLLFALITVLVYLPFAGAGGRLFSGLATYAADWRINDSLFSIFAWLASVLVGKEAAYRVDLAGGAIVAAGPVYLLVAKLFAALVLLGLLIYCLLRRHRNGDRSQVHDMFVLMGGLFLVSPVQDPWYLCWIVPFLVIFPYRSWILLTGLQVFYYLAFAMQNNAAYAFFPPLGIEVETWTRVILLAEYLPFYALLTWELLSTNRYPRGRIAAT